MNVDEYFEREEARRISDSPAWRRVYGVDVPQMTQAEAEAYMQDGIACPLCGTPMSIKGGHQLQAEHCRPCGASLAGAKVRAKTGRLLGQKHPKPIDWDLEYKLWQYEVKWKERHRNDPAR